VKRKAIITIGVGVAGLTLVCSVFLGGAYLIDLYTHARAEWLTGWTFPWDILRPRPTVVADPEGDVPGPTRTPSPIGLSRRTPFPRDAKAITPHWDVRILETVRGARAWQALQEANQFNRPAPAGEEYLLVKLHVTCTYPDREAHPISENDFKITGDRLIESFTANAVAPDPPLDAELSRGEEAEGWAVYLVGHNEGNLILVVDELSVYEQDQRRFIALDEGASLTVPSELAYIEPTVLGVTRSAPAPFGELVTAEDWQVQVLETIRGEAAWERVLAANQFNKPPADGMEYVLARVYVRNISPRDQPGYIRQSYFETTGSADVLYEIPTVVDPAPQLDAALYPGGAFEGWVTLQVPQGETDIVAVFEPWLSLSDVNRRFLSLEP
jgi:hypothetical protein